MPPQLAEVAVVAAGGVPLPVEALLEARAPALEDPQTYVGVVREKNANRMLKLSSSHALGPSSVTSVAKTSRPASVIW